MVEPCPAVSESQLAPKALALRLLARLLEWLATGLFKLLTWEFTRELSSSWPTSGRASRFVIASLRNKEANLELLA